MHIIVCLDDRQGMSFGGRRQSMDRTVRQDILDMAQGKPVHMSCYSAQQFAQCDVMADDLFLENAQSGDICFVENVDVAPYLHKVSHITVYRWNRRYPADLYFPKLDGWKCVDCREFFGYSHEAVTREEYVLWHEA